MELEEVKSQVLDAYQRTGVIHRHTSWLGRKMKKCPTDAWILQELVYETCPDLIIETGTFKGGTTMFLAAICDLVGHGDVITVDVERMADLHHPRITQLNGSSVDYNVLDLIRRLASGKRVMVCLDSDHSTEHVAKELEAYGALVSPNLYLVVEDSYHPLVREALDCFLGQHQEFKADLYRERFLLTYNPGGFLRKLK